jgi:uncharacterized protein (DUF58 family)
MSLTRYRSEIDRARSTRRAPLFHAIGAAINKEAWLRFIGALAGLSLAFVAAIFSTLTAEAGRVLETAILASLALLLAGAVGIITLPYLTRRLGAGRIADAIDYEITREGWVYLGLILVAGIAALNTGNNLLFIIVAAMLAAIVVSGMASAAVLRGLELDVVLPAHVFAGSPVAARIILRNGRRWLPSFSISVVPLRPRRTNRGAPLKRTLVWERAIFNFPWWVPAEKQWLHLPDVKLRRIPQESRISAVAPSQSIFDGNIYFPCIAAQSTLGASVQLNFPRRGRFRQERFGVATRFPFSFLKKTRRVALERELIVYPAVSAADSIFAILPMMTGEFEAFVSGRGYDLYRIRDYQPEDTWRHVDWKATAKTGGLKVREFTREDERKLRLVFDNAEPGTLSDEQYEKAVALVASLAWHFAGEAVELSFTAPGYLGTPDVYDFLRYLALVQPGTDASVLNNLQVTDDYNVIVTARPRGSIPTALWACSYLVFLNNAT